MGLTRADSILLSKQAQAGTEYHEAWHRVANLLITDKLRNQIYNRYRSRVKDHSLSDSTIDEIQADNFMDF